MKYLLCYVTIQESQNKNTEKTFMEIQQESIKNSIVKKEEFNSFTDAIEQYTLKCFLYQQVTLSEVDSNNNGHILRQYSCSNDGNIFIS